MKKFRNIILIVITLSWSFSDTQNDIIQRIDQLIDMNTILEKKITDIEKQNNTLKEKKTIDASSMNRKDLSKAMGRSMTYIFLIASAGVTSLNGIKACYETFGLPWDDQKTSCAIFKIIGPEFVKLIGKVFIAPHLNIIT